MLDRFEVLVHQYEIRLDFFITKVYTGPASLAVARRNDRILLMEPYPFCHARRAFFCLPYKNH